LPGTPLPLHIFEPRYKEMIAECLANNTQFGVVRALEEGVASVGCTAEIVTVTKEYPDGRLDLVAEGRNRFEVLFGRLRHQMTVDHGACVVDPLGNRLQDDRPDRDRRNEVTVADVEMEDAHAGAKENVDLLAEVGKVRRVQRRFHLHGSDPFGPGHGRSRESRKLAGAR